MMDDEQTRAKKMIIKVEIEKSLCEVFTPFFDGIGYDTIASLMCTSTHDVNRLIGKILRKVESDYSIERPENWNEFSKNISKDVWNGSYHNLSKKAQGLRDAVYSLAVLADCFEYIEKVDFEVEEN